MAATRPPPPLPSHTPDNVVDISRIAATFTKTQSSSPASLGCICERATGCEGVNAAGDNLKAGTSAPALIGPFRLNISTLASAEGLC